MEIANFQVNFQDLFPFLSLTFCNFSPCLFLSMFCLKHGAQHMDLITAAVIWVCAQLIRKSSGKPKNSFQLYIILNESTHVSFREKIIKI